MVAASLTSTARGSEWLGWTGSAIRPAERRENGISGVADLSALAICDFVRQGGGWLPCITLAGLIAHRATERASIAG
jgi:hypothetical protein